MSLADILKTFNEEKVVVEDDGRYVEKDSGGVSLKGALQRGRLKLRKGVSKRPQGVTFRPSTITFGYCRRLKVAQLAGLVQIFDETPTPRLQLVFDMGSAIHDIVQGYFWDIGLLKGSFKCTKCEKIYHDLIAPQSCPSGIASHTRKHLKYKEIVAKHEKLKISGRADGILVIDGEEHVMDIKSIANRVANSSERQFCFEDLATSGPKDEHVVQLMLYLWIFNIDRGHLFYVAKNNHQIASFAIPYDYEVIRPYLEEIQYLIDSAESLKNGLQVELPVPCGKEACPCHEFLSKRRK